MLYGFMSCCNTAVRTMCCTWNGFRPCGQISMVYLALLAMQLCLHRKHILARLAMPLLHSSPSTVVVGVVVRIMAFIVDAGAKRQPVLRRSAPLQSSCSQLRVLTTCGQTPNLVVPCTSLKPEHMRLARMLSSRCSDKMMHSFMASLIQVCIHFTCMHHVKSFIPSLIQSLCLVHS